MRISDCLYGDYHLEKVLEDLINSSEVQRLKDIHMVGPTYLLKPQWNETRYEHSIGVMLLIRKLGGQIEEQIAGLLHDISHTAFSHLIDLVMKKEQENYHEEIKEAYLAQSSIPDILKKHGFDYQPLLLDDTQWPILEQEAPLLCADRIDYTLREVHRYFGTDLADIQHFLSQIEVVDQQLALNELAAGEWFISHYYKVVIDLFYAPLNLFSYRVMSDILAYALKQGYLATTDFMKSESQLLKDLQAIEDCHLKGLFQFFYSTPHLEVVNSQESFDFHQKMKMRLVDPLITVQAQLIPTSQLSPKAQQLNLEAKEKNEKGVYLKMRPLVNDDMT